MGNRATEPESRSKGFQTTPQTQTQTKLNKMPEILRYQPGSFCWSELMTTDPGAMSEFYSILFGWIAEEVARPSGEKSIAMRINGKDVAALKECIDGDGRNAAPHWFSYVSVLDIGEVAGRASRLGGCVLGTPGGQEDVGRMAVISDPLGARLGLWQPGSRIGARLGLEPNTVCWTELSSPDPVVSAGFYSGLFGWTVRMDRDYFEYSLSGASQAGMVRAGDGAEPVVSHWSVYFRVSDCDRAAEVVARLGGSVLLSPTDIPGVGRFSRLQDPSGAVFSVVRLEEG